LKVQLEKLAQTSKPTLANMENIGQFLPYPKQVTGKAATPETPPVLQDASATAAVNANGLIH
jgi:hypothetical protein